MKRGSVSLLVVLLTALVVAPGVAAQTPSASGARPIVRGAYNSYIVIMKGSPLVTTVGRDQLDTPAAASLARTMRAAHDRTLRAAGISASARIHDYVNSLNGFQASVTYEQAQKLAADRNVALVLPDELRQKQTDSSGEYLGLDKPGGAWDSGVTGKGVVVGVIDTGIWPEHPSFADKGLPNPPTRPSLPCDFGNTAHNSRDRDFNCQNKLVGARQMLQTYRQFIGADPDEFDSARDDDGHGTHTASTAAGNSGVQANINGNIGAGKLSGMAPDAHIIAYKALGNLGGFTSDLAAAIDQAVYDRVDVVNYSIGGGGGSVGGDGIAMLFAADAGLFIAVSAGNSGSGAATIGGPADVPWVTGVGANTQARFFQGTVQLGNGATYFGSSVTGGTGNVQVVDAAKVAPGANGAYCLSDGTGNNKLKPAQVAGKIVLCKRGVNGRVDKSLAVDDAGGVGMILYNQTNVDDFFTDNFWVPTVMLDFRDGKAIKKYIRNNGASARAQIKNTRTVTTFPYAPSMTLFSSRGPNNWPDIIKPDITAPGLQILAGASPFPDEGSVPGHLFQSIGGTSMSSPHMAGLYALLKQEHPNWSAAVAKSAMMTTAFTGVLDNDRQSQASPFAMGSGHANPGRVNEQGSAFSPGLVYKAGFADYLGWLCGVDAGLVSPQDCADLESAGYSNDPSNLNYPSIGVADLPGSQVVKRTLTSVATQSGPRVYRVSVEAPVGFTATVSPSVLTLARGQSATYRVTFTNQTAPIGEWRFGSLTWRDTTEHLGTDASPQAREDWSNGGIYRVRSPIALRASLFDAPSRVTGSGVSGDKTFPVRFGYTGNYQAKPHGLTAATVTHATVKQDPDQNFAPSDVGNGATVHNFNLSGVGLFRVALPPESVSDPDAIDLDVYVYNPQGQLVGASGNGGTDELVDIVNPANGTWKVYVHGWQTAGPSSAYDLYSWAIPKAAGGGNLTVTDAPPSAVKGTSDTVTVHWAGATAGKWHLGYVSHHGPGGSEMSRTLIEVDNR